MPVDEFRPAEPETLMRSFALGLWLCVNSSACGQSSSSDGPFAIGEVQCERLYGWTQSVVVGPFLREFENAPADELRVLASSHAAKFSAIAERTLECSASLELERPAARRLALQHTESPRESRRPFQLSQATWARPSLRR